MDACVLCFFCSLNEFTHACCSTPNTHTHTHTDDDLPDRNCDKCVQCCVDYEGWLAFQNCLYKVIAIVGCGFKTRHAFLFYLWFFRMEHLLQHTVSLNSYQWTQYFMDRNKQTWTKAILRPSGFKNISLGWLCYRSRNSQI
jgi:hypothetical protein